MFVVRRQLRASEGAPPNTRVNPDTGNVETSTDGGATWTENPEADPRLQPAQQLPPNTAPDVKCAAAAGMVENVRKVMGAVGLGVGAGALATLLIGLLLIPGIGWIYLAMLLFAASATGATGIAMYAAFTDEVYDWLLCAFLDQLDADGRITDAGLDAVVTAARSEFPNPLVGDGLALTANYQHFVGFNNAGVVYADPDADCTCAEDWCVTFDEFGAPYTIVPYAGVVCSGTLDTGFGNPQPSAQACHEQDGFWLMVSTELPTVSSVSAVSFQYYFNQNTPASNVLVRLIQMRDEGGTIVFSQSTVPGATQNTWQTYTMLGEPVDDIKTVEVGIAVSSDETFEGDGWIDNFCVAFSAS